MRGEVDFSMAGSSKLVLSLLVCWIYETRAKTSILNLKTEVTPPVAYVNHLGWPGVGVQSYELSGQHPHVFVPALPYKVSLVFKILFVLTFLIKEFNTDWKRDGQKSHHVSVRVFSSCVP